MIRTWLAGCSGVVALLLMGACSTDSAEEERQPGPDRATATVTPEAGGVLKSADGRLVITIPPGAVSKVTALWVESMPKAKAEAEFPNAVPKGLAYELGPDGQKFAVPALADLKLALDELPSNANGMPVVELQSRSKGKDEMLTTGSAGQGPALAEPASVMAVDLTSRQAHVRGDLSHFSQVRAEAPDFVLWAVQENADAEELIGNQWQASFTLVNISQHSVGPPLWGGANVGEIGSCKDAARIVDPRGPGCPMGPPECCMSLSGTEIGPGVGSVIPPTASVALDPPVRFKCASAGKASFTLSMLFGTDHRAFFTKSLQCVDPGALGAPCQSNTECNSGVCADGVCCDSVCQTACYSCNVPMKVGTCSPVPQGQTDGAQCASPDQCNGAGKCLLANGKMCASGTECVSGNCTDLTCCDTACTGMCMQCDISGSEGSCTNVPSGGTDPDGCFSPDKCDGKGACMTGPPDASTDATTDAGTDAGDAGAPDSATDGGKQPNGAPCSGPSACASGFCADGVCCHQLCTEECRGCVMSKTGASDGFCTNIKFDTDPDTECPGPQTCSAPSGVFLYCGAHYGDPCTSNANCPNAGSCRDGVCCNMSNCTSSLAPCSACTKAKTGVADGTCASVLAGTDPFNSCAGASVCNGSGGCM